MVFGFGVPPDGSKTVRNKVDEDFRTTPSVTTDMASSADVDSWEALGGKVDLLADTYVAPTGKRSGPDLAIAAQRTHMLTRACIQANITTRGKTQPSTWRPTWQKVLIE